MWTLQQVVGFTPILFNTVLYKVIKALNTAMHGSIFNKEWQIVAHADDTDIIKGQCEWSERHMTN